MNLGELKSFLGDKPDVLPGKKDVNQTLKDDALRQVAQNSRFVSLSSISTLSSSLQVGARVLNVSISSSLAINGQAANLPNPQTRQVEREESQAETQKGLFDFEEVAKNVLNFVGGAIRNAKAGGADQETLQTLFSQAREGVLKGIALAEDDLAGFMNEEIAEGIASSQALIEDGINRLERNIFAPNEENVDANTVFESTSVNYTQSQSGELTIRTRDGDEVTIAFEDARSFEYNRQALATTISPSNESEQVDPVPEIANAEGNTALTNEAIPDDSTNGDLADREQASSDPAGQAQSPVDQGAAEPNDAQINTEAESYQYYEGSSLSFSVRGELDEDELSAIGTLVNDANALAEQFFYGDIESAFEQAQQLGFDDSELSSFALQLTRVEQVEVVNAYESVAHFNEEQQDRPLNAAQAVRPVADYLERMLDVIEQSRRQLESGETYENLVNGLINQLGEDVQTPDLIGAINRFHGFNKRLLDNLPSNIKEE